MKQAIINILNAIADRIKPKIYEYEMINRVTERQDDRIIGYEWVYFCKKTGSTKIIKV